LAWLFRGQQALDGLDEVMKLKEPGATMRYQAIAARARGNSAWTISAHIIPATPL